MPISIHCKNENIQRIVEINAPKNEIKNIMIILMHCKNEKIQNIVEINTSQEGV